MNQFCDNETDHDFREVYYGWQCYHCDLFYAFGSAPWEDDEDDLIPGDRVTVIRVKP
jgi:hypothetical protein